jgi:hypothetical protein
MLRELLEGFLYMRSFVADVGAEAECDLVTILDIHLTILPLALHCGYYVNLLPPLDLV